jgi:hypothetical protein
MAGASDYLENKLLEHVFKATAYSAPATVYAALYTAAPSDAGGGTECAGGSYDRVAVTFGAASAGSISNSAQAAFPTATGSWGTVTAFGIFDASSGGNLLAWNTLTSFAVASGQRPVFDVGQLTVTCD